MRLWSEDEFNLAQRNSRLQERTLDACKDVLVGGMTVKDAAEKHKMFAPQISRANTSLASKLTEQVESATKLQDAKSMLRETAIEVAKHVLGPLVKVKDAEPGKVYEGPMVLSSKGYLVQKVGPGAVLYEEARFQSAPPLNVTLFIKVPARGAKVEVFTNISDPHLEKSGGLGR